MNHRPQRHVRRSRGRTGKRAWIRGVLRIVSTAGSPRFEFVLRRDELHRVEEVSSRVALAGAVEPRRYELALLLAECALRGEAPDLVALRKELVGLPHPDQVRKHLRALASLDFVRPISREVWIFAGDTDALGVNASELARARTRFRAGLATDERLGLSETARTKAVREEFFEIERAFEREELGEVLRRIEARTGEGTYLTALLRAVTARHRPLARFLAHALAGVAAMNVARLDAAEHHLDAAEADATDPRVRRLAGPLVVRVAATRTALLRMRAAMVESPREQRALLDQALVAWEVASNRAHDEGLALSPEERQDALRWCATEGTTPLALLAELARKEGAADVEVERHLAEAYASNARGQELLGAYRAPVDAVLSTDLLAARIALLQGEVSEAERILESAEELATRPSTPRWLRGWLPRYLADLAFTEGRSPDVVGHHLAEAWALNGVHAFQRLLLVARVGAFDLGPESIDDLGVSEAMERAIKLAHVERRGLGVDECPRCRVRDPSAAKRALARRARCAVGMDAPAARGAVGLGVWR